ncbi:hypothetical protein UWK_01445 [Desulfocapsa sulfexigens DSM 10523]|uniref:Uncharacterized protein n=1 Tax=Desulfocapsa sulfexigens (strain DSM 10523 / SB164P1) TaxID=1167006 RepID=M1PE91_DESSD|nr:hypothetical protein [Desulfocapsa sulfexigens]AGF78005.1 hypothetical protein UWK_01445 [Desulfocapsa sulfexigens DSM 10523]
MSVKKQEGRDLKFLKSIVDNACQGESSEVWLKLKNAYKEAGYEDFIGIVNEAKIWPDDCLAGVCSHVACLASSSCDGGACTGSACNSDADVTCKSSGTCGNEVCGKNSGGGPVTCTYGQVCGSKAT